MAKIEMRRVIRPLAIAAQVKGTPTRKKAEQGPRPSRGGRGSDVLLCSFAGVRDRVDRGRDLHARRRSAHNATADRTLSPGPFWARTGEKERGSRL